MRIVERVREFITGDSNQDGKDDGDPDTDHGEEVQKEAGHVEAPLSRCATCDTTYINLKTETCPDCKGALTEIPNDTDLGQT